MEPKASRSKTTETTAPVRISAIVVTYYTGDSLELCLRSLFSEPWIDPPRSARGPHPSR